MSREPKISLALCPKIVDTLRLAISRMEQGSEDAPGWIEGKELIRNAVELFGDGFRMPAAPNVARVAYSAGCSAPIASGW